MSPQQELPFTLVFGSLALALTFIISGAIS